MAVSYTHLAIDLLNSAASLGYEVEYNRVGDVNSRPRAGAVFVQDTTYIAGHSYGHTGVVYEDSDGYTLKTIEQNVDGNWDALYVGCLLYTSGVPSVLRPSGTKTLVTSPKVLYVRTLEPDPIKPPLEIVPSRMNPLSKRLPS